MAAGPAVTLQSRPIYVEDFLSQSGAPFSTFAQVTDTILGLGPNITVTPIVVAINDAVAALAGVPVGGIYINVGGSFNYLRTRMS